MNVLRLVRISFCICDWLLRNLSFLPIKKTCTLQFFPCKKSDLFSTSPDKTNERDLFFTKCIKLCSNFFQFEGNYKYHFIFGCFGEIPYIWQLFPIQRQRFFYERHVGLKKTVERDCQYTNDGIGLFLYNRKSVFMFTPLIFGIAKASLLFLLLPNN